MNTILKTTLILIGMFLFTTSYAQKAHLEEVIIKTSTQCGMCKERVEKEMAFTKGVKKAKLNVEKAEFAVVFDKRKTNIEKIRQAIADVGYDADDVKASPKAYRKLPQCCQKGGHM